MTDLHRLPTVGSETIAPKRLVRLSFNQRANTAGSLLGPAFREQVAAAYALGDATARTFPPLLSPREGLALIDGKWEVGDNVANARDRSPVCGRLHDGGPS